ncbi:protein kinase [Pseudogemmatithrix spongiicola]|uniref:non-specific serine/threonine protein kinase n=1 Tax=Pseudogemmatithrix spongiicola TaxID=3062599 RepID=A0AA49JT52_9BACT|nr:protein kinase [Gemmatimonadaceae bacterium 'strain 138']WKW14439.1 protein kinase [Gemmatimonadaceae bacterium 'strain 318']
MSEQKVCPTCGTEYPLSERFCPRDGTALRSSNTGGDLLGSVVADRYHVIKKLGEGGMGAVYLAEHVKMGRKSALKVMHPGMNSDPDAIARFNREASNASRLSHPNICGIYDFGETPDGLIYLAMEFIEGKALTDLIEAGGSLQPARAASIVHQVADALQVAHDAGIVHRDLKPDNIMVAKNRDGSDLVKVVDFGIAKASSSDAQKVTKTGLVVGTPEYMSPEQLAGDKLDGRSDIYSLGLVAFNCLTGKLPFPSESAQEAMIMRLTDRPRTLAEIRPDVSWPEELQAVLDHALARDAAERYQSAAQFGREFAEVVAALPATQAAEGATMVIGAATAAAKTPAARTAATAPPPTRVAGKGAAAPAKAAPVAVEKKSPIVPIVGGVAAVAVIGFFAVKQFTGSPAGEITGDTAGVTQLAGATGADTGGTTNMSNQLPDNAPTPNPTGTNAPTNTGTNTRPPANTNRPGPSTNTQTPPQNTGTQTPPQNTGTQTPPSGGGTTGGATQPNPAPTTPPAPAGPPVRDRLIAWQRTLLNAEVTEADGMRIARESAPLRANLTGVDLGQWYVVQMLAYGLYDLDRGCAYADSVIRAFPPNDGTAKAAAEIKSTNCQ